MSACSTADSAVDLGVEQHAGAARFAARVAQAERDEASAAAADVSSSAARLCAYMGNDLGSLESGFQSQIQANGSTEFLLIFHFFLSSDLSFEIASKNRN